VTKRRKKEYCVWSGGGFKPVKLVRCYKTKKAAQRFARRDSSWQVFPRVRSGLGGVRKRKRRRQR
jgi:hypothetical protein